MSQKARPSADAFNNGWVPDVNYYRQINEAVVNDSTIVLTENNPLGSEFEVRLSALSWPSSGTQTLRVRLRKTASGTIPVRFSLLQGSNLIASRVVFPTSAFDTYELPVTQAQYQTITDYTNLRLRVKAGVSTGTIPTSCCPARLLPATLVGTFSNQTGSCNCVAPERLLTWIEEFSAWEAPFTSCGYYCGEFSLACVDGTWHFDTNCDFISPGTLVFASCNPFVLVFDCLGNTLTCVGNFRITITEE